MSVTPSYGETPVDDEFDALLPAVRQALGEPVTKAAVYDIEQAVQDDVGSEILADVLEGNLALADLLTDRFVRDLHRRLYCDIWVWAGKFRTREFNLGVAPERIAVEMRQSLDWIRYRWEHTADSTSRALGIAVHAEVVRVHPFTDGNGRTTRLLADLVFVAAQYSDEVMLYDWQLDKRRYIDLLRQYDLHRDVHDLAGFVGVKSLGE